MRFLLCLALLLTGCDEGRDITSPTPASEELEYDIWGTTIDGAVLHLGRWQGETRTINVEHFGLREIQLVERGGEK